MLKTVYFSNTLFTLLIIPSLIFFNQVDAHAITVKGTAYQDKGLTPVADNTTVSLMANGTTSSVATSSTGYIINSVTAPSGTTLTVFINDASSTGVTVTRSGGSDINDLHIYQNHLIVRSDDGSALTIANMTVYDKSNSVTISFDAETGGTDTLTVDSGNEFYIWSGSTFSPAQSSSISIAGSWTSVGTFTANGGIVTFDGAGPQTITSGGWPFYNLTFSPSNSATYTLADDLEIDNDLTITGGGILDTHSANSNSINIEGSWTISGTGVFIARNGIVTFDDDQSGTHTITTRGSPFYNLTFSPSASATSITYILEDALEVDNDLAITVGILDTKSGENNSINVEGSWTNSGTSFIARNGTVTFDDDAPNSRSITTGGSAFYNLTFNASSSTTYTTYTLVDALDVDNDLTITAGILDTHSAVSNTIKVAGNWTNYGTFTANSGTVTFDGSGAQIVNTGNSNWNALLVTNALGSVTFADKFTCATFSCTTPRASLNFKYKQTDESFVITASGGLNLVGNTVNPISLRRYQGSGSDRWYINPSGGSWTVSYVDVKDSYNSHATYINPSNSTNSGNNFNWFTQDTSTTTTSITTSTSTTTTAATTTTTPTTTTTITTPATTTTTPASTTTQPFSCVVVINPSSETVGFEQTVQFSASTACDDEPVAGIYSWDVDSIIGSTIDDDGLYKAGTAEGKDTVKAIDIANDNVFNIAKVTVGLNIEVSPSEVLRSRWIPYFALMSIKGSETNFELLKTIVNYDSISVLPLPALVLPPEDIYQIIMLIPSWFNNVWEDEPEVKVTVTTDSEVAVGSFNLKMLPEPLDEK